MHKFVVIFVSCLGLSGCFFSEGPWPSEGAGGFAEYLPIQDKQLQDLSDRLDALRQRGAPKYDAAAYADASLLLTRCRREMAAGLTADASADIARLERQIDALEAAVRRKRPDTDRTLS
ncbi:hypothetical protein DFR50_10656 [Roseiarcus fermentans]|uniref:Lipoprotein n=1 Tax=Roseiarcus fermentans TaxID=1473586 RepID=A0A366FN26_9HYPH|nr:hypothetical protein [Roseiarcus fermentans]RBP16094.1 hypothetical protein DFR50_10656 [Roseiarcus fermentans]